MESKGWFLQFSYDKCLFDAEGGGVNPLEQLVQFAGFYSLVMLNASLVAEGGCINLMCRTIKVQLVDISCFFLRISYVFFVCRRREIKFYSCKTRLKTLYISVLDCCYYFHTQVTQKIKRRL